MNLAFFFGDGINGRRPVCRCAPPPSSHAGGRGGHARRIRL